ncbi:hypothetical protein B6I21_04700 [candidate division KSB1 bacterium 4572_119]|nr:MAG: hypothetical protein B6I21_04700 [candidate division KSB1 bacterium 4572_119]
MHINGGNPTPVLDTYWSWSYNAKISPNGKSFLFLTGMENNFWWRRGYLGSNSTKIWMKNFEDKEAKLVYSNPSNCYWQNWDPAGEKIYFVSDQKYKTKNIWVIAADGSNLQPVTEFKDKDITWMSISRNKFLAVYERDFGIWITQLSNGESHPLQIDVPIETKNNNSYYAKNKPVSEFRLSPDGKKIAAVVRGEIFVLSTNGGYARNITHSHWRERDVIWDKDSKYLIYVSDFNANPNLYKTSALGDKKRIQLTNSNKDILAPTLSPDGKWIAYFAGQRQIRLIQPNGKKDYLLIEDDFGGRFGSEIAWSPDSKYLAVVPVKHGNSDIFAIDIKTKKKTRLTNTAYDESGPLWSMDGKFLLFSSNRYGHSFPEFTGKWDIYQVYLQPEKAEFKEDKFEKLFSEKKKSEEDKDKKSKEDEKQINLKIEFKLEDIDLQTKTVTNTLGNDRRFVLSPKDTSTVYFVSNVDGTSHLWETNLSDKKRGKYEPFMSQIKNLRNLEIDKKGKFLYYLSRGKIGRIDLKSKKNKSISFDTKIKIDKTADYEQMLAELYYTLEYYYYDNKHHQVNWKKIYQQFLPVLQQVREDTDFFDYANQMIGYLNSSHTGIYGPNTSPTENRSGHVGAVWEIKNNEILIDRLIKNAPLYAHRDSVTSGDKLISINNEKVKANENFWKLLNGNLGERVKLTIKNQQLNKNITVAVKPISSRVENRLLLEEWINSRKEIVKNNTEDQIAYIYMRAMGQSDLTRFLKELERDAVPRKGLILDLRNNFGGNVHDRVLQALMKPVYAKWQIRGLAETPQSTYGFADKPVVLLINEVTLSDGEMTANGFRALNRGPIIGNTTYGWLIFTTSSRLMNGGSFRLPFWGCYTLDGKDLETSGGVKPDIFIINDLNDDLNNRDPQLDKAIEKVLELTK